MRGRQLIQVADPEIRYPATQVLPHVVRKAFPKLDVDARKALAIFCDHLAHAHRNQARHDDLSAKPISEFLYALNAELQILEHAFGHRDEFATGRRERDLTRIAQE